MKSQPVSTNEQQVLSFLNQQQLSTKKKNHYARILRTATVYSAEQPERSSRRAHFISLNKRRELCGRKSG